MTTNYIIIILCALSIISLVLTMVFSFKDEQGDTKEKSKNAKTPDTGVETTESSSTKRIYFPPPSPVQINDNGSISVMMNNLGVDQITINQFVEPSNDYYAPPSTYDMVNTIGYMSTSDDPIVIDNRTDSFTPSNDYYAPPSTYDTTMSDSQGSWLDSSSSHSNDYSSYDSSSSDSSSYSSDSSSDSSSSDGW